MYFSFFCRLSSLPTYSIPRDGSLQSYKDYITILPVVDQPEAFGQHSNADITSLIIETRVLCETLMSLQVQSSSVAGESRESKVIIYSINVICLISNNLNN